MTLRTFVLTLSALSFLAACENARPREILDEEEQENKEIGRIFGDDLLNFSSNRTAQQDSGAGGIAVNGFLWRATLDTIAFFPLAQADPFGGVIITDWHTPPETPNTRFKLNIIILGRELRADGLQVSVFRQDRNAAGQWVQQPVAPETVTALENAILTKARELRIAARARE